MSFVQAYLLRTIVRTMSLSLVARGPWEDAVSWLLAAHAAGLHGIDEMFVEISMWYFRSRRHEGPAKALYPLLVKGLNTGPKVAAAIAEVARQYQQEEALLAAGVELPDSESLNLDHLFHCSVWQYPTHHHHHPAAMMVPHSYGPRGPTHEELEDFSDLEDLDNQP